MNAPLTPPRTVLVTGATGFVGRAAVKRLKADGWTVRSAGHSNATPADFRIALTPDADWTAALANCDAVVHLGARAHILTPEDARSAAQFMSVNAEATLNLARTAARLNVRHFVFMSSIAVNGPMRDLPLSETQAPNPENAYGRSKLEAETGLLGLAAKTGMPVTLLRPPLVYGPHVKGRFLQMLHWCYRGIPLPLGGIANRRSFLAVDNLADAIACCLVRPEARNQIFNIADERDVSTPQMLAMIATALDRPMRLINIPWSLMRPAAALVGKSLELEKLAGSLLVDTSHIHSTLGWHPPVSTQAGVQTTAKWFLSTKT